MPQQRVAKRDEGIFDDSRPDWSTQRQRPLEIMCLGLCRTGTTSMLEALTILGYGTSYNSREMLRRGHTSFLGEALRRKYQGGKPPFTREQFESCWGDYTTISGEPAYVFAAECLALYPDAKVILTVRDSEEAWLRSLTQTMWYGYKLPLTKFLPYVDGVFATMRTFSDPYWKKIFWDDVPNHGLRVYREHNAMVERLGAGRVLVYNTREGWGPLCEFLGKEVPQTEFPHVNKTQEHRSLFSMARKQALMKFVRTMLVKGVLPAVIVGCAMWHRRWVRPLLSRVKPI